MFEGMFPCSLLTFPDSQLIAIGAAWKDEITEEQVSHPRVLEGAVREPVPVPCYRR
jgi:hypothetical protein